MVERQHDTRTAATAAGSDTVADGGPGRGWRDAAACLGVDPEVFFPTAQAGPVHDVQVAAAKQVCRRCPVQAECRAWAVKQLPVGVAGGLDEDERRALRTARPGRARPRVVAPPVGGTRREFAAAGRAAVAAGESVRSVARRFGVDERTAYHWRATSTPSTTSAVPPSGSSSAGVGGGAR